MRRAADEVDGTLAQRLIGFVDGKNELERNIEALAPKETKLNRRGGRKVRVRNDVGNGKFHCLPRRTIIQYRSGLVYDPGAASCVRAVAGQPWTTTIFPPASLASITRCASRISSKPNTRLGFALSRPAATC